jgi:putative transposase
MLDEILPEGGAFYVKARVAMEAIRAEKTLSQLRQCKLLGANRSGLYYQPLGESEENLQLMRLPDEQYTRAPFYGSRRMVEWLATKGFEVNRKRVRRLMEAMGIEAVYPKPKRARREKVTGSIRTC